MSFELLSEPIKKFIRKKGWEKLRPIQDAAISKILQSDEHIILASRTASGKTEAAFLPILSSVNFNDLGVQVLYVSPLIALINDQFLRIEEICKNFEVTITKWHGEASKTLKQKLIRDPEGIVLITPESLESMLVNKPYDVKSLFSNLKYVVVDEIHSFIGTDRGIQLQSILYRLQKNNSKHFRIVGLSATIGDYTDAKKITGEETKTKVLLDKSKKNVNVIFRYFESTNDSLSLDLLKDLYVETKDTKVLIFPNSRGRVEEVSVKLKKISDRLHGHSNYFSHHSSINNKTREYIEYFAKNNKGKNFCIACTSTLELGIDIGSVDQIVQIDATNSISSLIQRVGRSGRKEGDISNLYIYSTNKWSLLQSLACWILHKENYIEPSESCGKPFDILLHQALSITKEFSGIDYSKLITELKDNYAFSLIEKHEIEQVIEHLIQTDFLEKVNNNEIIIGINGEKLVNNKDFYSVFMSERTYKVISSGNVIGQVPFSHQILENENIFLSAQIWKIKFINHKSKSITVIPTKDGKKPVFFGNNAVVHQKIREKMFQILYSDDYYDFLDQPSFEILEKMRQDFSSFNIKDLSCERPLRNQHMNSKLYTFSGTKTNRTIEFLFNVVGIPNRCDNDSSSIEFKLPYNELNRKIQSINLLIDDIENNIFLNLQSNPEVIDFSKWGRYLPDVYKVKLIKNKYYDIHNTKYFLEKLVLVSN
jgi:ATP-dependent Lhr-like helicase